MRANLRATFINQIKGFTMDKIFDDAIKIRDNETVNWLEHKKDWISGTVGMANGIVEVYAEPQNKFAHFMTTANGYMRIRSHNDIKKITSIGLRRMAKKFLEEVQAKNSK